MMTEPPTSLLAAGGGQAGQRNQAHNSPSNLQSSQSPPQVMMIDVGNVICRGQSIIKTSSRVKVMCLRPSSSTQKVFSIPTAPLPG